MKQMRITFSALAAVLLLAACGDLAGIGNPSGGNNPTYPSGSNYPSASSQMRGTVNSVDTQRQRIDMTVNAVDGRGVNPYSTSIYFDSRTRVVYNNQSASTTNLERGDGIDVQLYASNNGQPVADTITVISDVRNQSGSTYPNSGYPTYPPNQSSGSTYPNNAQTAIQGTVSYVDTRAQRIDVTGAYVTGLQTRQNNNTYSIYYDSRTRVLFQGQTYQPSDLERGDQIDARAYPGSNGQYVADTITVTRNVRQ
jgi:hypothetical protein